MASVDARRWMLIDDSDEDVSYSGDWFVDTYTTPGPFRFSGIATAGTAHGTNTEGGFTFSFEGTDVIVRGQSNVIPASTNSMLRCTIDGAEGESDVVSSSNLDSWRLCGASRLSEGRHQVMVNVTTGPNTQLWLDEIFYYSLNRPNLRRQTSLLSPTTQEFGYSGISWTNPFDEAGSNGRESYQNGAKVTVPFFGASVELAAYMTSSMPRVPGAGTYSVDGGSPVRFEIPAWVSGFRGIDANDTIFRHSVFTTPTVSPGHHTLEVINLGNSSTVPLSIDYFLVHHGDVDATTATAVQPNINTNTNSTGVGAGPKSSSSPSGSTTNLPSNNGAQKSNVGIIAGAAVGALVLLAATCFLFFWIRKRRRAKKVAPSSQWNQYSSTGLNPYQHGFPINTTPYRDVPNASGSDVINPPGYTESGFLSAPEQTVMQYPQASQQLVTIPQEIIVPYTPAPQQTHTHLHITPFTRANGAPEPPLGRLPPEKLRLPTVQSMVSISSSAQLLPSPSSTYSHGSSSQSPAPSLRTLPPPLSPLERLTESPATSQPSIQAKFARAVPPRVPPPRRLPPKLPPVESEPPVYHE